MRYALSHGVPLSPPLSRLRALLIGTGGLRPGWGLLCFLLLLVGASNAVRLVTSGHAQLPAGPIEPFVAMRGEGIMCALILGATWTMGRLEGRHWLCYGLGERRWLAKLTVGLAAGLALLASTVLLLWASGHLQFDAVLLHGWRALGFGALWLAFFLLLALTEESLYRGYLQTTLARGIGFWPAAVLLSAAFGSVHLFNSGETAAGALSVGIGGLLLSRLLWRSGSLWLPIGVHAAWDWSQSFLFGTPDSGLAFAHPLLASHPIGEPSLSGGSVGPEGSPLTMAIVVPGLLLLSRLASRRWPAAAGPSANLHAPQAAAEPTRT